MSVYSLVVNVTFRDSRGVSLMNLSGRLSERCEEASAGSSISQLEFIAPAMYVM